MPDISPYTKGIADCLESLGYESPEKLNGNHEVAPRLINMLQGRMLEHLKTRVSSHYGPVSYTHLTLPPIYSV